MLKKLMKYEWKKSYKIVLLLNLFVVLSTVAAIATIHMGVWNTGDDGISTLGIFMFILYSISISFVSGILLVYIACRYYKFMYSDESYLTHTLPVKRSELLLSQLLVNSVYVLVTSALLLVCMFGIINEIFVFLDSSTRDYVAVGMEMGPFTEFAEIFETNAFLKILFLIFSFILSSLYSVLLSYAAVSMGQLFTKHKIIGAIVCYIGIYMVLQTIMCFVMLPFTGLTLMNNMSFSTFFQGIFVSETIIILVFCVVFYWITHYILEKKLNLD